MMIEYYGEILLNKEPRYAILYLKFGVPLNYATSHQEVNTMIAALRQNLFSLPRHDGFSLIRVMFGPFIVLGLLMLPWAHSSGTWLPTVLVWVCFTLSGCAEKLPKHW